MTDSSLLAYGMAVIFTALAGAYVFIRGRYQAHQQNAIAQEQQEDVRRVA